MPGLGSGGGEPQSPLPSLGDRPLRRHGMSGPITAFLLVGGWDDSATIGADALERHSLNGVRPIPPED